MFTYNLSILVHQTEEFLNRQAAHTSIESIPRASQPYTFSIIQHILAHIKRIILY